MDKRFLLALALTAVVVVVTPMLFQTTRARPRLTPTTPPIAPLVAGDSAKGLQDSAKAVQPSQEPVARTPATPVEATTPTPGARPETTTVTTATAEYRYSSLGAQPLSVTLRGYRALDGSSRPVQLPRRGEALLRYTLVGAGDSLDLNGVQFRVARQADTAGAHVLTYVGEVRGRAVSIEYTIGRDEYLMHVAGTVSRAASQSGESFLAITLPSSFDSYEADTLEDQRHLAFAVKPRRSGAQSIPFAKLDPGERRLIPGPIVWAAAKSKYFIFGVLPGGQDTTASFAEFTAVGGSRTGKIASHANGMLVMPLPGGRFALDIYAGPQQWERLLALGRDFENSNPYGGFLQPVVQPFATIVMRILLWMHRALNLSYGWVLILFGITVRLALWPLNQNAMRASIKMQRIQPEISEVQKRYKSDPQRLQTEMMRVYKEHGMSPFSSLSGCLPMLLPMPVLFALFFVFQNTIEFRGVPFLWLHDISIKDPLYIIPLLMGLSMYGLSWIGMRQAPPNQQAKVMAYMLPAMMTLLFLNFAAGLNLYYTIQNLAALPQQWLLAHERAKNAPPKPVSSGRG